MFNCHHQVISVQWLFMICLLETYLSTGLVLRTQFWTCRQVVLFSLWVPSWWTPHLSQNKPTSCFPLFSVFLTHCVIALNYLHWRPQPQAQKCVWDCTSSSKLRPGRAAYFQHVVLWTRLPSGVSLQLRWPLSGEHIVLRGGSNLINIPWSPENV